MRLKDVVSFSTFGVFVITITVGCSQSDVSVVKAPPSAPLPSAPLPKDVKRGGGPGSSGNMKGNPFEPLSR